MRYETQLTYSIPLLRRAVFAYWKRSVGFIFPIVLLIVTVDLILLLSRGDRSWVVGALLVTVVISFAFISSLYFVHYRNALRKLDAMGLPQVRFVVEDSTFTVESGIGISTLHWSSIKELWTFPNFWLLLFSKAHFVTIPVACLTPEMAAFVLDHVRKAGGTISPLR